MGKGGGGGIRLLATVNRTCLRTSGLSRTRVCTTLTGGTGNGSTLTSILRKSVTTGRGGTNLTSRGCRRTVCFSSHYAPTCLGCTSVCGSTGTNLTVRGLGRLGALRPSGATVSGGLTRVCCLGGSFDGTTSTCSHFTVKPATGRRSLIGCTFTLFLGRSFTGSLRITGVKLGGGPHRTTFGHLTVCGGASLGHFRRTLGTTSIFFGRYSGTSCSCLSCVCCKRLLRRLGGCSRTINRCRGTIRLSPAGASLCGGVSSTCRRGGSCGGTVNTCRGCCSSLRGRGRAPSLRFRLNELCCNTNARPSSLAVGTRRHGRTLVSTSSIFRIVSRTTPSDCLNGF